MFYFLTAFIIILFSRMLSGSWRTTFILPWVLLTIPVLLGAGLANIELVPHLIVPWSSRTHLVVILGTFALGISSLTLKNVRTPLRTFSQTITWYEGSLIKVLLLVTCIAITANALQFLIGGAVPLFSSNPDQARIEVGKNGYLHIFSVLPGHLIPIGAFILLTGKDLKKNTRFILIGMITVCFLLLSLWIARGLLLYPFLAVIALSYLLDQTFFRVKKIFMIIVVLLLIVSGIKYLRGIIQYGEYFDKTQKQITKLKTENPFIGPVVTLYLTFTLNYEILNRYVSSVPALAPHTNGRLIANHLLSFVPAHGAAFTELDYQNRILKKQDQSLTLTSTCFGIPYLDFGMIGVLLTSVGVGILYRTVWICMIRNGSPLSIFFYGYLISMTAFLPFTFIYTQVSFIWFIISSFPLLLLCMCSIRGASIFYRKTSPLPMPTQLSSSIRLSAVKNILEELSEVYKSFNLCKSNSVLPVPDNPCILISFFSGFS